jgi:uncharacterized protein YjiK
MSAHAWHMISTGLCNIFLLKQILFLIFQIDQHIAAIPTAQNYFPLGSISHTNSGFERKK